MKARFSGSNRQASNSRTMTWVRSRCGRTSSERLSSGEVTVALRIAHSSSSFGVAQVRGMPRASMRARSLGSIPPSVMISLKRDMGAIR